MNADPFIDPQKQHGFPQPSLEYGPGTRADGPGAGMPPHGVLPHGVPSPGAAPYGAGPHGVPPQQLQQGGPSPWAMREPSAPPFSGQYAGYGGGAIQGFDDGMSELRKYEKDHRPPKHGQLSFAIMILASVSLLLTFMSLFTKEWRSNTLGVVGYSVRRSWGLFSVVGQRTQSHYDVQQFTCRAFGGLSVGGICSSPICSWYKLKCQVYIQLMWVSYTAGLFICIAVIIHMICMYWTYHLTPRLVRWAGTWWFMDIFFQVGAIAFWSLMTEDLFASLDTKAIYPTPDFSMSFFFCCLSSFLLLIIAFLAILLMKIWPEPDEDDDSDDELLAEDNYEFAMMDKRGCPPGGGPPAAYVGGPAGYVGGPPAADYVGGAVVSGAHPEHAKLPPNIESNMRRPGGAEAPAPINPSLGVARGRLSSHGSDALQQHHLSDDARQSTE